MQYNPVPSVQGGGISRTIEDYNSLDYKGGVLVVTGTGNARSGITKR